MADSAMWLYSERNVIVHREALDESRNSALDSASNIDRCLVRRVSYS